MVSKIEKEKREEKRRRLDDMLKTHVTIEQASELWGVCWSRAFELSVGEEAVPVVQFSKGGKMSPKWLIPRDAAEAYSSVVRPMGRPRVGDKERGKDKESIAA